MKIDRPAPVRTLKSEIAGLIWRVTNSEDTPKKSQPSEGQPDPHEDFTIAQTVEAMKKEGDPEGLLKRTSPEEVTTFLQKWGSEHPSNYEAKTGRDWKGDLFGV